MEYSQILESLCTYDKRSPEYQDHLYLLKDGIIDFIPEPTKGSDCSCDNCFYGRHELANEILNLKELINE